MAQYPLDLAKSCALLYKQTVLDLKGDFVSNECPRGQAKGVVRLNDHSEDSVLLRDHPKSNVMRKGPEDVLEGISHAGESIPI